MATTNLYYYENECHKGGMNILEYVRFNNTTLSFPLKLLYMIQHIENEHTTLHRQQAPIGWAPNGQSICVRDRVSLVDRWIPLFFGTQSIYPSFSRKLYRWGFFSVPSSFCVDATTKRLVEKGAVSSPSDWECFRSVNFRQDKRELIYRMESRTAFKLKSKEKAYLSSANMENDRKKDDSNKKSKMEMKKSAIIPKKKKSHSISPTSTKKVAVAIEQHRVGPTTTPGSSCQNAIQQAWTRGPPPLAEDGTENNQKVAEAASDSRIQSVREQNVLECRMLEARIAALQQELVQRLGDHDKIENKKEVKEEKAPSPPLRRGVSSIPNNPNTYVKSGLSSDGLLDYRNSNKRQKQNESATMLSATIQHQQLNSSWDADRKANSQTLAVVIVGADGKPQQADLASYRPAQHSNSLEMQQRNEIESETRALAATVMQYRQLAQQQQQQRSQQNAINDVMLSRDLRSQGGSLHQVYQPEEHSLPQAPRLEFSQDLNAGVVSYTKTPNGQFSLQQQQEPRFSSGEVFCSDLSGDNKSNPMIQHSVLFPHRDHLAYTPPLTIFWGTAADSFVPGGLGNQPAQQPAGDLLFGPSGPPPIHCINSGILMYADAHEQEQVGQQAFRW